MSQGTTSKILLKDRNNLAHIKIVSLKTRCVFKYQFYVKFSRKANGGQNTYQHEDLLS